MPTRTLYHRRRAKWRDNRTPKFKTTDKIEEAFSLSHLFLAGGLLAAAPAADSTTDADDDAHV